MNSLALALPLLPGKTEEWKSFTQAIHSGGLRRAEMEEFQRRNGITLERWFLQHTPHGDFVVVYMEGDIQKAFTNLPISTHPFDTWLKENWLRLEGIDFNKPLAGPPPHLHYEFKAG